MGNELAVIAFARAKPGLEARVREAPLGLAEPTRAKA